MFNGAEQCEQPDTVFEAIDDSFSQDQKLNKDIFKNLRAHMYYKLRKAIHLTFRAVVHREYIDPDELISFDSNITDIGTLRSELCRMPIKPNRNNLFELYTKDEMKKRFRFKSPNLADSVMMFMKTPYFPVNQIVARPKPIKPMGRR
jgi:phage terminase large subunit